MAQRSAPKMSLRKRRTQGKKQSMGRRLNRRGGSGSLTLTKRRSLSKRRSLNNRRSLNKRRSLNNRRSLNKRRSHNGGSDTDTAGGTESTLQGYSSDDSDASYASFSPSPPPPAHPQLNVPFDPWIVHHTVDGRPYFENRYTGQVSWSRE